MKNLLLTIFTCCFFVLQVKGQAESNYFFENFQEGIVVYKDGKSVQVKANYDFVLNEFLFVDVHDNNEIKRFADINKMAAIRFGDRVFLPKSSGATEILQTDPLFHVQYKGLARAKDKQTAYGGKSATSSSVAYSALSTSSGRYELEGGGFIVGKISKNYIIQKQGKNKSFSNEKQFLKLYPNQQEELQRYMEENQIDFNNIPDVIELYNYAESL